MRLIINAKLNLNRRTLKTTSNYLTFNIFKDLYINF